MGIINQYPYTDLHSINLDYVIKLCRENMGLHLEISGDRLLLKTEDGKIISSVVIPYATEANHAASATHATNADTATVAINANYASSAGSSATADNAANATHAVNADHATSADSATTAASAASATSASSAVEATHAVSANTALYAERTGAVDHADKALESVTVNGNQVRFTTYDGTNYDVTIPYAVKAANDDLNNPIKETYVANVVNDIQTGKLQFLDAEGNTIVELIPTVNKATNDSYDNLIADFIKAITVSSNSNYVTVTHGTGTADSLTIHYSETAWKDTNGNVIKNSYIKRLACEVDPNDHKYKLVAYNGDNPEAEIFRIELTCENAKHAIEADHATSADSATNAVNANHASTADTATTAATSTGSISSISGSVEGYKDYINISNGDGTSTNINIFDKAVPYLDFEIDPNTNDPWNLSVNQAIEYVCTNYTDYIHVEDPEASFLLDPGRYLRFLDEGSQVYYISILLYSNALTHFFTLTDGTTTKTYKVESPLDPTTDPEKLRITRVV